jgi:hypothetical protein
LEGAKGGTSADMLLSTLRSYVEAMGRIAHWWQIFLTASQSYRHSARIGHYS